MKYNIWGDIVLSVDFEVEAENEVDARKVAINRLNDMYHLNVTGAYHNPKTDVEHKWYADENEEEQD